jgi:hypothetical protein
MLPNLLPRPEDLTPDYQFDVQYSDVPPRGPSGFCLIKDDGSVHAAWSRTPGMSIGLLIRAADELEGYDGRYLCQTDLDLAGISPGQMTDADLIRLLDHIAAIRDANS